MFSLKNAVLGGNSSEKVAAVYHRNGKDIWVIWHNYGDNCFNTILLTKEGFLTCTIESCIGISYYHLSTGLFVNQGQLKFNDQGNKLVQTILNANDGIEILNFDNLNGNVIGPTKFKKTNFPTSVEFSSNSEYLIISSRDSSLIAFNIYTENTKVIYPIQTKNNRIPYIQRNNKNDIICAVRDSGKVGIILKDNFNSISYNNDYFNLRNGKCNSGLPNFNQSYFYTPSIDFSYKFDCTKNQIAFEGRDTFYSTAHNWQIKKIGKPVEASYILKNVLHTFNETGDYEIQYIAINGNRSDTIKKALKIYPKINKNFLGKDTFYGQGTSINKTLSAPKGMHCYFWYSDSSNGNTLMADTAGVYVARITNNAFCIVTDTIIITECINDLAIPSLFRSRDTLYTYHLLTDSFVWYRNNEFYKITKSPFLILTDTGTYRVEAAKQGHCNRSSSTQKVNKLDVEELEFLSNLIKIYPNPVNNLLNIDFLQAGIFEVRIYNILGQIIFNQETQLSTEIDLHGLTNGVYLIQITNAKNQQLISKFFKE